MSAINEWFGSYYQMFKYVHDTYGEKEFEVYLRHIADVAYDDVCADFREKGLPEVARRNCENIRKDGGKVTETLADGRLTLDITVCPDCASAEEFPDYHFVPGEFYCGCCTRINARLLENAGFHLKTEPEPAACRCRWTVEK